MYDEEEFTWTEHDRELLRELAAAIAGELERGSLAAELKDSTARLTLGFAAANIGSFDWDLSTNALQFDDRWIPDLDAALDELRERYGSSAITRAVLLGRDQGLSVPLLPD